MTALLIRQFVAPLVFLLAGWAASGVTYAEMTLRIVKTEHPLDVFAAGALDIALAQLDKPYDFEITTEQLTQHRMLAKLMSGDLDVLWMGTNLKLEETLLPVRFPIFKGLLGYRVCIISPQKQEKFARIQRFEDLQDFVFGLGQDWSDIAILQSNGLRLAEPTRYHKLFYMAEAMRFDGFPRGILEPWVELEGLPNLDLTVDKKLLLEYTLPFYFFVRPGEYELAQTLHTALDAALKSGAYDAYFFNHPMIQTALQNAALQSRVRFHLHNPSLPPKTPLDVKNYWFSIEDFMRKHHVSASTY